MKTASIVRIAAALLTLAILNACIGGARAGADQPVIIDKANAEVQPSDAPDDAPQAPDVITEDGEIVEAVPSDPEPADPADERQPVKAEIRLADDDDAPPVGDAYRTEREKITDLYMRAQERHQDGDYVGARNLLVRVKPGQPYYDTIQRFIAVIDADIERVQAQAAAQRELQEVREGKVHRLYREAEKAYNAKRYQEAVKLIQEAFELDPENLKVRELRADARSALATVQMKDNSRMQDVRIAETMREVEKIGTVPEQLPPIRRPNLLKDDEPESPQALEMEKKLNQLITVNLDETPLDYLLNILFRTTGVNIIAKPEDIADKNLTLHVQDIKLIDLLDYISKTMGVTFTRSGNALWLQGGGPTTTGPLMQWRVIPLNKGLMDTASETASETSDLERVLNEVPRLIDWPDGSEWYLDRMTNALIVRTTSESMKQFETLVRRFDVTPVQVLIETKFIEISSKAFDDLGIEWRTTSDIGLTRRRGMNQLQIDAGAGVSLPSPVSGAPHFPSAGFDAILAGVMTVPQFQLTLHALQATGHTSNLGQPHIIAVNNSTAEIEITRDNYYVQDYDIDRQTFDGSSFSSQVQRDALGNIIPGLGNDGANFDFATPIIKPRYDKLETGFKLRVRPSVGRDLRDITLYLEPEIVDLVETLKTPIATANVENLTGSPLQVEQPVTTRRKLTVKLTVSDGYVVAMGGLVQQTKEEGVVKVPLLGDIPLLGHLFRHRSEKNVKTNLLIFVTAKILTPEGRTYIRDEDEPSSERAADLGERIEVNVH